VADPSHKIEVGPNFDHRFVVVGHNPSRMG
jgi:hypothetical protein